MRPSNFTTATPEETAELNRLTAELRSSTRLRSRVFGMRAQDVFAMFFAERAGETGSR